MVQYAESRIRDQAYVPCKCLSLFVRVEYITSLPNILATYLHVTHIHSEIPMAFRNEVLGRKYN